MTYQDREDPLPWFEFLKNRNEATHLYDEQKADEVYAQIGAFVTAVENLIAKISKD
ncbi:MAG: nucleotidyltransferase substrate binding protein [Patescibacteria group bacterium]